MFIYWYKKKLVGPFDKDVDNNTKKAIKNFINSGILDNVMNHDLFPDADPEEFITITDDEDIKKLSQLTIRK